MKNDVLKQYVSLRESLSKEKVALEKRLAEINHALVSEIPSAPSAPVKAASAPRTRKRAQNTKSLRETVVDVLKDKPLGRQEILDAVLKTGYVFSAKDPLNSLSTLLYTDKKTFKNKDGRFAVS